jgi:hypothetical protein
VVKALYFTFTRKEPLAALLGEEEENKRNLNNLIPISQLSNFSIRHHQTFLWHNGALKAKVFHSFAPTQNPPGYRVVYKIHEKGFPTYLEAISVTPKFDQMNGTHLSLGPGEDPRAFHWNRSSYCLTWQHKGSDWDHRMINLDTGQEFPLNHCVRGFRGKNWSPLVYKNRLYVVYVIDPELIWFEYDLNDGCKPPPEQKIEKVTGWRGGSNFVPYDRTSMITIGHQTVNGNTHHPYLIHIDMETNQTSRVELARKSPGILDPTSLWQSKDNRFWMGGVHTSGCWFPLYFNECDHCSFNMSIYEIVLENRK